jgi:tetratricopeptide (TPR) repeat protein
MQDVLTGAIERHRSGHFGPASQLYQKVLAREQQNSEALHSLGVLQLQQGNHARAIELISRALALKPRSHICHANLAVAHGALGDFERAAGCCRAALSIWPSYPEALCNLETALQGLGKHAESRLNSDLPHSSAHLGLVLHHSGQAADAVVWQAKVVELDGENAEFWQRCSWRWAQSSPPGRRCGPRRLFGDMRLRADVVHGREQCPPSICPAEDKIDDATSSPETRPRHGADRWTAESRLRRRYDQIPTGANTSAIRAGFWMPCCLIQESALSTCAPPSSPPRISPRRRRDAAA